MRPARLPCFALALFLPAALAGCGEEGPPDGSDAGPPPVDDGGAPELVLPFEVAKPTEPQPPASPRLTP